MTRKEFDKIKRGSIVITNGSCRGNAGIKCKVLYICEDRIWITPIDGQNFNDDNAWCCKDWNEVSYKSVNIVNKNEG